MNILQLNDVLHTLCMKVPTVNSYYSQDVYEAWNTSEVKYASMAFNLMNTLQTDTTRNFEGVIYYADRLTEDKSNQLHIFADADNAISGVLFNLEDSSDDGEFSISDFQIMHFKQNFADFLAGGYAHITIKVANDCDIVLLQKKLERIINITENGVYDVTNYTTAVVDVIPRWGAIQGNIKDQEDLMNLFGDKLDKTTNVSVIYGTDSEGNQIEYTAGEGIILENGQIINTGTSPAPSEEIIEHLDEIKNEVNTVATNQNIIITNQNVTINKQTEITSYICDLETRVNTIIGNQNASNEILLSVIDDMDKHYEVTVKAFGELGDKLDQIIENTKGGVTPPVPPIPPVPPFPPDKKVPQFETLIVKSSKNGISSDGCWYFDDRYSTLKNAVGKLKLDSSKEIIPAENAIITTTIKYKDGRTGNYQVWNGGFEYNAPYYYKKSKSSAAQKSITTTVTNTTTPKTKQNTNNNWYTVVPKVEIQSAQNVRTETKQKPKKHKTHIETNKNSIIWDLSKPIKNEEPKKEPINTKHRTYTCSGICDRRLNRIIAEREWKQRIANDWRPRFHGDKPPKFPGT